ncbi:MAG: hypothetical protein COY40_05770 [Alphaproteobacteria bacterium CG_4_10_14_0_8_um_filter_53_9]|nr:MAG: hypothetical protein COY40_05770 [Alphaproteobacteria bacterium CG_4_10_14_0_8_um_filter_53_9]
MGGKLITNDTLQMTRAQGFPAEFDLQKHLVTPYAPDYLKGKIFQFTKPDLRFYQTYGIRVFLVENIDGKWVYWGMIYIRNITLDYIQNTTSGEFEILEIFSPERMKQAFSIRDARPDFDYFLES